MILRFFLAETLTWIKTLAPERAAPLPSADPGF
jgi:hypothetical protein